MSRSNHSALVLVVVAGAWLLLSPTLSSAEAKKSRSVQSEARWIGFDAEAHTVTVKIVKPGKIADKDQRKQVKSGKQIVFGVKPEGSVLTRTTVAINGMKSEISDIEPGRSVYLYWVLDPERPSGRFARKIDVLFSREELEQRYGVEDE